jgi:hypothetical protein
MSDENAKGVNPPTVDGKITRIESRPVVSQSLDDFGRDGVWVEVDPETAEEMGVFEETAVSVADVEEADDGN